MRAAAGAVAEYRFGARRAALELAALISCVEVIMWIAPVSGDPKLTYEIVAIILAAFLAASHLSESPGARQIGLRLDNLLRSLRRQLLPLSLFILIVALTGAASGTLRLGERFFNMLLMVPPWALMQQYMLLAFAHRRLRKLLKDEKGAILTTSLLFSLLHLPNVVLAAACAFGGYIWAREYEREPNLLANSIAHALASAFLANSLPGWLLKNMVVGYNYLLR
jgi:membrane protease YdiL (CAAX protease family)